MRLNRVIGVLLLLGSFLVLFSKAQETPPQREVIDFIQFKKISLENLFDYLSARYGVNIVIQEPTLRYYTTSLRLRDVSVEEVIQVVTDELRLHYVKKEGGYYISTRKKFHEENYNSQNYITRAVKLQYASITDVTTLLKDVMHGTAIIRSTSKNVPYRNLFDATPKLEEIDSKETTQSGQSGSNEEAVTEEVDETNAYGRTTQATSGPMSGQLAKLGIQMQESMPENIVYIIPFANENIIYLLSRDETLIKKAQSYISEVDQPIKEVLIQGKIINVGLDDGFSSFFEFNRRSSKIEGQSENPNSVVSIGNLQYTFLDSLTNMNIELLQNEGKAKTIASPMLLTANRNKATLDLVEEVSIIRGWSEGKVTQIEGGGAVSIPPSPLYQTENIGTEFEIIPYINSDEKILLKIRITISTLKAGSQQILVPNAAGGYDAKQLDGVSKTTIETTLITSNGQGIVLGGLVNESVSKQESKVPILGDIPFLGFPFKSISDVTSKSETVVVLTPFITNIHQSKAHETMRDLQESLKEDRYLLHDDNPPTTGLKLLDNMANVDITKAIDDAKDPVNVPDNQKEKIRKYLQEGQQ